MPEQSGENIAEKRSTRILLDISLGLLVVFLVARIMVSGLNQEPRMPSINKLIELFVALALVFWILSALAQRRLGFEKTAVRIPVLIFMALIVISVARASYPFSAAHAAFTWVTHICAFFLVVNLGSDRRRYNVILSCVIATLIVVSILAFYQYFHEFKAVREYYEQYASRVVIQENLRDDFVHRLYLDEAFSTFIQPNTFAGYLIMVLPLVCFLAYGAVRKRLGGPRGVAVLMLGSAIAAGALYLTGSKGAYLALAGGAAIFAGFYYLYRRPPEKLRKARLNALIMVAAFVVFVTAAMIGAGYENLPESVKVRLGYWDASMRMMADNPFGVGIANFRENYTIYQRPWATEVRSPHNSYLAIWTELSIAALAAFAAVLLLSARRYLTALRHAPGERRPEPETGDGRKLYLAMLLAGVLGCVLVALLGGFSEIPFTQPRWVIALAAVLWVALAAGLLFSRKVLDTGFAPAGVALGLLAFACHAFIDFDFYSHGINATFWVLLGLLLCHCCRLESAKAAPAKLTRLGIAAAALIIAVVMFFGFYYLPRALSADAQARGADCLREDAARSGLDPALTLGAAQEFEKAQKLSPWKANNYMHAAELYQQVFIRTRKPAHASNTLKNYSRLLKVRANSHNAYIQRGVLRWLTGGGTKEGAAAALSDIEKAVALYPVNAGYRYCLGLYLERSAALSEPVEAGKLKARAREEFEKAFELHKTVVYERGRLPDRQFEDVKRRLGVK